MDDERPLNEIHGGLTQWEVRRLIKCNLVQLASAAALDENVDHPSNAVIRIADYLQERLDRIDTLVQCLKVLERIGS